MGFRSSILSLRTDRARGWPVLNGHAPEVTGRGLILPVLESTEEAYLAQLEGTVCPLTGEKGLRPLLREGGKEVEFPGNWGLHILNNLNHFVWKDF